MLIDWITELVSFKHVLITLKLSICWIHNWASDICTHHSQISLVNLFNRWICPPTSDYIEPLPFDCPVLYEHKFLSYNLSARDIARRLFELMWKYTYSEGNVPMWPDPNRLPPNLGWEHSILASLELIIISLIIVLSLKSSICWCTRISLIRSQNGLITLSLDMHMNLVLL